MIMIIDKTFFFFFGEGVIILTQWEIKFYYKNKNKKIVRITCTIDWWSCFITLEFHSENPLCWSLVSFGIVPILTADLIRFSISLYRFFNKHKNKIKQICHQEKFCYSNLGVMQYVSSICLMPCLMRFCTICLMQYVILICLMLVPLNINALGISWLFFYNAS